MGNWQMDNSKCKVLCQQFGMKALGPDFEKITNPTKCCDKCDEKYKKSFLQVNAAPSSPTAPTEGKPTVASTPVKR